MIVAAIKVTYIACKQRKKISKEQNIKETKIGMYRHCSMQWEKFDEIICCVSKNTQNIETFTFLFLQSS